MFEFLKLHNCSGRLRTLLLAIRKVPCSHIGSTAVRMNNIAKSAAFVVVFRNIGSRVDLSSGENARIHGRFGVFGLQIDQSGYLLGLFVEIINQPVSSRVNADRAAIS